MVPFALRSLLHDKIRLVISAGGVAFAVLLILILRGILDGTVAKATVYIDHSGADLFIAREGVEHMAMVASGSILPTEVEARARAVEGVAAADGLIRFPIILSTGGNDTAIDLIGFSNEHGLGGPWRLSEGTPALEPDGAVVDRALGKKLGLDMGDTLMIGGEPFRIQGISSGTSALGGGYVFIRRDSAARLMMAPDIYNFVLVRVAPGADPATVAARLRAALPDYSVISREDLAANDRAMLSSLFITPVNVMATIGLLVGLAVIGLTTYSAAAERAGDFGILKAIGARNGYLYGVIIRQALMIGVSGFLLGLGLSLALAPLVESLVPELGVAVQPAYVVQTAIAALVLTLVAALIPVRRMAGLDPKLVFAS